TPFIVDLFKDINRDGAIQDPELVPISDTGWLESVLNVQPDHIYDNPGRIFYMNVRVRVPEGTPAGDYIIAVKATSTNNPDVYDIMHLLVRVKDAPGIQVLPDNTATVVAGGSYIFSHTVVNTGNQAGTVTVTHSELPNGYSAVWVDCTTGAVVGEGNPSVYTTDPIELPAPAPGIVNSIPVCLKVFVPANIPAGMVLPITVTATLNTPTPATDTALDIITVIDGALQLTKTIQATSSGSNLVPPGGSITYRTTYKNLSPATLSDAVIADAIPANTKLVVTPGTIQAKCPNGSLPLTGADNTFFQYSDNNGITWKQWPAPADLATTLPGYDPTDETASGVTNIRFDIGETGHLTAPGGDVPSGESGFFQFQVIVK
ncbi:MAG TPA: hypothetical protein PKY10_10620, partial [Lentisphaeria bacterium]|nr:hypothetical protein [Lentisphaeria bacterium]